MLGKRYLIKSGIFTNMIVECKLDPVTLTYYFLELPGEDELYRFDSLEGINYEEIQDAKECKFGKYEEIMINGEFFFRHDRALPWEKMTNRMLTNKLVILGDKLV